MTSALSVFLFIHPAQSALFDGDVYYYGDVRLRGYYSDPSLSDTSRLPNDDYSGDSRARISLSLPITDSIVALATLRWSTSIERGVSDTAGQVTAGDYAWSWNHFDLGRTELRWNDILFSDASLLVGRTAVQYDDGLLFSAEDDAWLLDIAQAEYDTPALKLSVFCGEVTHLAPDSPIRDVVFVHGTMRAHRVLFPSSSLYAGLFRMADDGEPVLGGLRSEIYRDAHWRAAVEVAGEAGSRQGGDNLQAMISDLKMSYGWNRKQQDDRIGLRWTYASGDQQAQGAHAFVPLFNYEDWGRVFSPRLSNIHIVSLQVSMMVCSDLRAGVEAFHYHQARGVVEQASDANFNNGGYLFETNGDETELGSEIDISLTYEMQEWCSVELSAGHFFRGSAYRGVSGADNASEVRLQVVSQF